MIVGRKWNFLVYPFQIANELSKDIAAVLSNFNCFTLCKVCDARRLQSYFDWIILILWKIIIKEWGTKKHGIVFLYVYPTSSSPTKGCVYNYARMISVPDLVFCNNDRSAPRRGLGPFMSVMPLLDIYCSKSQIVFGLAVVQVGKAPSLPRACTEVPIGVVDDSFVKAT